MALDEGRVDEFLDGSGALKRGHFLLSSGCHSAAYVQCALLLEDPARAEQLGRALAELLEPFHPDSVLAPALGGVIIGHEVASALDVPFRFSERASGAMSLRRGFAISSGEKVALVEDVVTTGGSLLETSALAAERGAEVCAIGAILDRSGRTGLFHAPFTALRRLDLPIWAPEECPLCREGGVPESLGSRKLGT